MLIAIGVNAEAMKSGREGAAAVMNGRADMLSSAIPWLLAVFGPLRTLPAQR